MKKKMILIIVASTVLLFSGYIHGAIPDSERAALIALYNSTNGDNWDHNSGWKTPPLHTDGFALPGTEGSWIRVTLSGDTVNTLDLTLNLLSGSLPPELGNLSNLEYLDLSVNELVGSIPSQLGNLSDLRELILTNNHLSGSIPPELGNLSNLEYLDLSANRLVGSIPSQLGNLNNLEYLDLDANQLSGSIPPELGNLSNLKILYLCENQLSGSIPPELGNLSNLKILYLDDNQLSGSIPPELGNLKNLKILDPRDNQLSGSIPPELGNLKNLRYLCLNINQLSGSIPPELGNLSNLEYLYLYKNQLSGSIPPELGNLGNLSVLELWDNQLSGSIPSQLGNLKSLQELVLNFNQLSGNIPSELGNLGILNYLGLNINQLSGSIPPELGNLSSLKYLRLGNNRLSGSIPSQLGKLYRLIWLELFDNQLSGSIPSELGNLFDLDSFHLGYNKLSGSIPASFLNLLYISEFTIGYNCLSVSDPALRDWLNNNDTYWEDHQEQCSAVKNPTVTTYSVSSITWNSAVCGGNVTSDGGAPVTERGVCWDPWTIPSINDSKTTDGAGSGNFTSSITGLIPGKLYHVRAYATNSIGTSYGSAFCFITQPHEPPVINLNRTILNFGTVISAAINYSQTVLINNNGGGTLNWSASGNAPWLYINPSSGTGDSVLSVSVDPVDLVAGSYTGTITITDPNATNSPQFIPVGLQVYDQGTTDGPFGEFSAPVEGSSTYSSVPVTGWALDDIGAAGVKIYNGDTYIGDAVFVEGARPDVQAAYPTFPNNQKAGWGYMLLTNFLPGGGNGTYTFTAKATDIEGNEVALGSKTITIDNAHAVKPFGAIDTPTQGGEASGTEFRNNGWVLTPMPNEIPTDGSTINAYIDGALVGQATYNLYRQDIAELFPGYANSNNAWGYIDINTRYYSNGIHTIHWIATDSEGNSDGIGSRYFTIQNTGNALVQSKDKSTTHSAVSIDALPTRFSEPLKYNKGVSADGQWEKLLPNEKGKSLVVIKELERIEIQLGENLADIRGYVISQDELNRLPIGSTLDVKTGTFSWSPGPGFLGRYSLVFVLTDTNGQSFKKPIEIKIEPKFNGIQ